LKAEVTKIVEDLKNPDMFDDALQRLVKVLRENPDLKMEDYLANCSPTFQRFIYTNLDNLRAAGDIPKK
jgi:hypothetical protein